ncbi:3-hydroxyisobutyrate dehydrogenase-like beta-hydroxyacid dehydrogenase [Litoreibacter ponti]|uniref:3-hydroxyisobutyrate dehydrogenase-like beta-hydroxyacid dehydrogenase n=1 Tax=Litoreibacter ponti TaxID=1510457 RepID=A0A2T6BCV8_9RHOB|nr:DUF1932 domain-containing protein [Litoreibacter ponti]PTX53866.1 3-hydroxyisobutyrate dehydrogenase-like beta-hydroxyacid dehydrogenase [Litoreibacter ponti]
MRVGVLGYGEAGPFFARQLRASGLDVCAYDILLGQSQDRAGLQARLKEDGICAAASAIDLAERSDLILSTVTVANAESAALSLGPLKGKTFVDLNSIGPETKTRIAHHVIAQGGNFTAGVAMDTVPQRGVRVPLLLSGPSAELTACMLDDHGLNVRAVGTQYGLSAQIKLTRSIFIKGFEAVFVEAMDIAEETGTWAEVCGSLSDTFPGFDWAELVPYHIARVKAHGERRAQEMLECASMIKAAGLDAALTRAIAAKHRSTANR